MNRVEFKAVMGKLENAQAYLTLERLGIPMSDQGRWEALQDAIALLERCRGQVLREYEATASKGESQ